MICKICNENIELEDKVRQTQCNHIFHSICLMIWAKQKLWKNQKKIMKPDCPECQLPLNEKNLEAEALKSEHSNLKKKFFKILNTRKHELKKELETLERE